jgi:hypothetical protein
MLNLMDLDERTRQLMLEEIDHDVQRGTLYVSPRLSNTGQQNYLTLLRAAARGHDADWLTEQLGGVGRMRTSEPRRKPSGGVALASVPSNAAAVAAEGAFKRYYMRALCRRAIEDGLAKLEVYRARPSKEPRPESEALIGTRVDPRRLLDELRANPDAEPTPGLLPGPNSGLSVRLPDGNR